MSRLHADVIAQTGQTDANALRRPMSISDWTFALGLPLTEQQFVAAKPYSDFCYVPPPLLSWTDYRAAVIAPFERLIQPLAQVGLHIAGYVSLVQYARLMTRQRSVVLFTHCARNSLLEFRGGLTDFNSLAGRIDANYMGISEVCACAPHGLQEQLKAHAPNAVFKVSNVQLSLRLWMTYYSSLLSAFARERCDFVTATFLAQDFIRKRPEDLQR